MSKKKEPKTINKYIEEMEFKRKLASKLSKAGLLALFGCSAYAIIGTMLEENYDIHFPLTGASAFFAVLGGSALILAGYYLGMYVSVYEDYIAELTVPSVLEKVMDRLDVFEKDKTFSKEIIDDADMSLAVYYERLIGEDYTKGVFRGIPLEMAEFHQQEKKSDGDSDVETWNDVFNGVMILTRHNLELTDDISITQYAKYLGDDVVKTESLDFNEDFSIRSKDGHSVFMLLTPQFIEELIKLSNAVGKNLGINYKKDGRLFICIRYYGLFEVGSTNSEDELLTKFKKDMDYIGEILRVLKVPTEAELN